MGKKKRVIKTEIVKSPIKAKEYIGVLNGVRTFAIIMVVCYHYWQQSFLGGIRLPFLEGTDLWEIPKRTFFANGSLFVEVFILLTGFCLFLPHARSMFERDIVLDKPAQFYKKRAVRLLPSIWFSLIVWAVLFIRVSLYPDTWTMCKDIFNNFFLLRGSVLVDNSFTKFAAAGVLWTVTIEVFFYILFPWIAKLFKKWPVQTCAVMIIISDAYTHMRALPQIEAGKTDFHRAFICYTGVFALGMLGAYTYQLIKNTDFKRKKLVPWISTAVSLVGMFAGLWLVWSYYDQHRGADMQAKIRLPLALCFTVFIVGLCFALKGLRVIFSNPVTKFFSSISLNVYIWHMFFALKLKDWKLPWYPENTEGVSAWPQGGNFEGHLKWQILYLILCWVFTIATAVFVTYCIEKPVAKFLLKKRKKKS